MQKKYFFCILLAALILLPSLQPVLALEVTYPVLPGAPNINANPTLINYIQYFFVFSILIAGILGIISIVTAGINILLKAGDPGAIGEAREQIINSVLGIVLLMISFIILGTINPQLLETDLTALSQEANGSVLLDTTYTRATRPNGTIYTFTTPQTWTVSAPAANRNIRQPADRQEQYQIDDRGTWESLTLKGADATQKIRYNCPTPEGNINGPRLMVWKYNKPNFEIDRVANGGDVATYLLDCGNAPGNTVDLIPGASYSWEYEKPGVYFYLNNRCQGISSHVYDESLTIQPFDSVPRSGNNQTPTCLRIVNSREKQFGVILNKAELAPTGECSRPILNQNIPTGNKLIDDASPIDDFNGITNPRYAYVFEHIPPLNEGEVRFESSNLYENIGFGDFYSGDNNQMYRYSGNLNDLIRNSTKTLRDGGSAAVGECQSNDTQCLKMIRREQGNFRVVLYSADEAGASNKVCMAYTCQEDIFEEGNPNRWIFNSRRVIYDTYVIPMPSAICDRI